MSIAAAQAATATAAAAPPVALVSPAGNLPPALQDVIDAVVDTATEGGSASVTRVDLQRRVLGRMPRKDTSAHAKWDRKRRAFRRQVDELVARGALVAVGDDTFALPQTTGGK